mmetsp:Transcript_32942/g.62945  ORF Transcript_32942/g.62945 Transcript_32942/m.62945 type:complete len:520 (-) Transcript_32942:69-1628(-)
MKEAIDTEIPLQTDAKLALDPSIALEDIVIKAYIEGVLSFDASQPRKKFVSQILRWIEMVSLALQESNTPIEHLPIECLYKYERRRLLEASFAYEESLLPDFFTSPKGGPELKKEFEEQRFCSVDTDSLLSDPNWVFLFDAASTFTIPKQRKAFFHIGTAAAGGSLVEKTMATDQSTLKEDKYFFFADHDHLAPCVWSDAERQIIAEDMGEEAATCPEYLLSYFNDFLLNATAADSDVVIHDEWLSMPSSEMGLLNVLGDYFDPVMVITYRRFFDWVLDSYNAWRLGSGAGLAALDSTGDKVRLVDFIRRICNRLFEADFSHEQTLVDLLDVPGYTYNLWEQYNIIPAFRDNVKIVNFHDGHIVKSIYCDVLHAENACNLESDRFEKNESAKSPTESFVSKYVEIEMGLYRSGGVGFKERFYNLGDSSKEKMDRRGLAEEDLPKDCLDQSEMSMLLMASLEYERIMLSDYHSYRGEEETRQHFAALVATDTFCSVDLNKVIESPKWKFLFEPMEEFLDV